MAGTDNRAMPRFIFLFWLALAFCWTCDAAIDGDGNIILVPLTSSDLGIARRAVPDLALQQHLSLIFGPSAHDTSILVNVTLETGDQQLIISTDHFGNALSTTTCEPALSLTFTSDAEYNTAVESWDWVNFNDKRTFIMLVDDCPGNPGTNPWIVRNATYNEASRKVDFNATQTAWDALTTIFTFEWGQKVTSNVLARRDLGSIVNNVGNGIGQATNDAQTAAEEAGKVAQDQAAAAAKASEDAKKAGEDAAKQAADQAEQAKDAAAAALANAINADPSKVSVPLDMSINSTLLSLTTPSGLSIDVACRQCKTFGAMGIGGHVKGTIVPPTVDEFWMTVEPSAMGIDMALEVAVDGSGELQHELRLGELTLPAFAIFQKIISFGPKMILTASLGLKDIEGNSTFSTGVKATMNNASSKVDFAGKGGDSTGTWEPSVELKPVNVSSMVDGTLDVLTKLSLAVEAEFFGNAYGMGLAMQVPHISFNASSEKNEEKGVCPNDPKAGGVIVNGGISADLMLTGYTGSVSTPQNFLTRQLYKKYNLSLFEEQCFSFGDNPKPQDGSEKDEGGEEESGDEEQEGNSEEGDNEDGDSEEGDGTSSNDTSAEDTSPANSSGNDTSSDDTLTDDASSDDTPSDNSTSSDGNSEDNSDDNPDDDSSDNTSTDNTSANNTSSDDTSTDDASSNDTPLDDTSNNTTSSDDGSSDDTSSGNTSSGDNSSDDNSSDDTSSGNTSSGDNSSDDNSSDDTSSGDTSSDDNSSDDNSSDDTSSGDTSSGDTSSDDNSSDDNSSDDTSSGDTSSGDTSGNNSTENSTTDNTSLNITSSGYNSTSHTSTNNTSTDDTSSDNSAPNGTSLDDSSIGNTSSNQTSTDDNNASTSDDTASTANSTSSDDETSNHDTTSGENKMGSGDDDNSGSNEPSPSNATTAAHASETDLTDDTAKPPGSDILQNTTSNLPKGHKIVGVSTIPKISNTTASLYNITANWDAKRGGRKRWISV